jgi:hypothetical protein
MNTAQELDTELNERVFHQQLRIVRQRELVSKLEQRDDSAAVLDRARSVLAGLELSLADPLVARAHASRNEGAKPRLAIVRSEEAHTPERARISNSRSAALPSIRLTGRRCLRQPYRAFF